MKVVRVGDSGLLADLQTSRLACFEGRQLLLAVPHSSDKLISTYNHGRQQDFFQGWANWGSRDKSSPAGSGWSAGEGLRALPRKPTKNCENNA